MVERSLAAASPQEALAELIRSTAENYTLLRKLMNSQRHEQIQRILGEAARSYLEELGAAQAHGLPGPSTATRTSRSTFSPSA